MKRSLIRTALGIALAMVVSGCTQRITDFTVISTKNVQVEVERKAENRVVGKDCKPVFLVPLGTPNLKEAIDRAIEEAGTEFDALVDGVVYYKNKSFIFGTICYEVEGTPIATQSSHSAVLDDRPVLYHSRLGLANDLSQVPHVERNAP